MSQRVKGFKQFQRNMRELKEDMPAVLESAMQVGGMVIEREARRICPYETGNLRSSIHTEVRQERKEVTAVIGTNVEYAKYVEYGTSNPNYPVQPFLRPALDSKAGEALKQVIRVLNKFFERNRQV